jgi:hypothetical protein
MNINAHDNRLFRLLAQEFQEMGGNKAAEPCNQISIHDALLFD